MHSPTSLQADVPCAMQASSPTLEAFLFWHAGCSVCCIEARCRRNNDEKLD